MTSHEHDHTKPPSELELRVKALESLLVERRIVDAAALDAIVDAYETKIGPRNGAAVMARAWVDPVYKARLLSSDSTAAIAEMGFSGVQGEDIAVVENTPALHNMIVCTLCSWLPVADAWIAAGLVQGGALQIEGRHRPARRAEGTRPGHPRRQRSPSLGQHRGGPLHGSA